MTVKITAYSVQLRKYRPYHLRELPTGLSGQQSNIKEHIGTVTKKTTELRLSAPKMIMLQAAVYCLALIFFLSR
jgi:hypothetical protein